MGDDFMPMMRCTLKNGKKGWKWGTHGACYPTQAEADKQRRAIEANKGKK